jgi:hypothetical protein
MDHAWEVGTERGTENIFNKSVLNGMPHGLAC